MLEKEEVEKNNPANVEQEKNNNKMNEINDKCIENLTQLNNNKKSIIHAGIDAEAIVEEYENHSQFKPNTQMAQQVFHKQLNMLHNFKNENEPFMHETTHELFINPLAKNISKNKFALESSQLEQKIAAKFNKPSQQLGSQFQTVKLTKRVESPEPAANFFPSKASQFINHQGEVDEDEYELEEDEESGDEDEEELISIQKQKEQQATEEAEVGSDNEEQEDVGDYCKGGYHPVKIGDLYAQRYHVLRKLGWGHFSTGKLF